MADKTRGSKIKYRFPKKWLRPAAVLLALAVLLVGSCARYVLFISQTVYQESTSHLSELVHKSDNTLNQLVNRNRMILHLWGGLLEIAASEEQIRSGMDEMQQETGCAALYFLASDGNCMTQDGEKSSLGSQTNLGTQFFTGKDFVVNTALPGKPQMLVFVCSEVSGTYRGFDYDAVAITYYNDTVLSAIDSSAFDGAAHSYVTYPDGRVVLDSEADSDDPVYNLLAELRSNSNLSGKKFDALRDDFAQGRNGSMMLTLRGTRYYLVYENTGIQDWIMLGLVPVGVVNASMGTLWLRTVEIVTVVACLLMVLLITLIVRRSRNALRRKDTELLYKDELFTRLSRNVDDVFLMLDAETSRADYISPNIERLLGVPFEQVRQDIRVLRLLHPEDSPDRNKNFLAGMQCGEQCEWNADYAHQQTGERRWFHVVAMGSEVADRTKNILVMSDRTADRKINQALSEAVAAAEAASRAKSTFLSNMSHDIRTPMNAIIGFTTLAVSNIDNQERVKDYLTKTLSSSRHLLALINDILDMSRIESGKTTLNIEQMDLLQQIEQVESVISEQAHQRNQEFRVVTTSVQHEHVLADPNRLNQILMNILSNSVKYTPAGGHIRLEVEELPRDAHYAKYKFIVQDDGIGMSDAYLKTIFDPFTREEKSGTNHVQGTGLGMAITKSVVDLMGGVISVESAPGQGSRFEVMLEFPIDTEAALVQKPEIDDAPADNSLLCGMKFLCAEDNEINSEILQMLLESKGATCTIYPDGQQIVDAFAKVKPGDYDMILMDVQMPVMDGLEATRRIRSSENPLGKTIPILAMTANAFLEDMQKSKEAGMDEHLSKPVDIAMLEQVVRRFRITPPRR